MFENSSSASSANLYRAVRSETEGLCFAFGKMDWEGADAEGWNCEDVWWDSLKVEELDNVGLGWTGPI